MAAGAVGFWAARVALAPPDDPLADAGEAVTYEVVVQTLGQSLRFTAVAEWQTVPLGRAWADGVVTAVEVGAGDTVEPGQILFRVDQRPVVIASGSVPAFRDLEAGAIGADVAQLEALLKVLGVLEEEPNDTFDEATSLAVRAWQRSLEMPDDGIVRQGDVLYTPQLPVRVVPTEALAVGAPLAGGEVVINRLATQPDVLVPLTLEQRSLVPLTGTVFLTYPRGTWEAIIARAEETDEQGLERLNLVLVAPDGGPVCGDTCPEWISAMGRTNFPADIVVTPEMTGPVVPVAAIVTDAGGGHAVELADGTSVPVEVLVSTGGLAVVSGVKAGDVVVLPAGDPSGQ